MEIAKSKLLLIGFVILGLVVSLGWTCYQESETRKYIRSLASVVDSSVSSVEREVSELSSKLDDEMKTKLDELETKLHELSIKVDDLDAKVDDLNSTVEDLDSKTKKSYYNRSNSGAIFKNVDNINNINRVNKGSILMAKPESSSVKAPDSGVRQ